MAYEWRPGMEMFEAVWKRDGQEVFRLSTHAAKEADVVAIAHRLFSEHPEFASKINLEGTTVEVGFGPERPAPFDPGRYDPAAFVAGTAGWHEQDQRRLNALLASLIQPPILPG